MSTLYKAITDAYWPPKEGNCSAHVEEGNQFVDDLTIGELVKFFKHCKCGPTYCMVRDRVNHNLKQLIGKEEIEALTSELTTKINKHFHLCMKTFEMCNELINKYDTLHMLH